MTQIRHDTPSLRVFKARFHTNVPTDSSCLNFRTRKGRKFIAAECCAEPEARASVLSEFLHALSSCLHRFCEQLPKRTRSFPNCGKFPIGESFFEAHCALGVKPTDLSASEHRVFSDLALVLALIPDLSRWSTEEKSAIRRIVRAKAGSDELRYVRLLQRQQKLRDGLLAIGSRDFVR